MATKIFKTRRVIYRVEQNEDGTLNIYREYFILKNMDEWQHDGRKFDNAGSLIITAGGIEGMLRQCEEVEDIGGLIARMNAELAEMRRKAAIRSAETMSAIEAEYHEIFGGNDAVETNAKSVYVLLRYLNTQNFGLWQLPKMTVGYACHQYDCDGRTATTIKLDNPIMVAGEEGQMFQYGAPRGHLSNYRQIVDWE